MSWLIAARFQKTKGEVFKTWIDADYGTHKRFLPPTLVAQLNACDSPTGYHPRRTAVCGDDRRPAGRGPFAGQAGRRLRGWGSRAVGLRSHCGLRCLVANGSHWKPSFLWWAVIGFTFLYKPLWVDGDPVTNVTCQGSIGGVKVSYGYISFPSSSEGNVLQPGAGALMARVAQFLR